MPFFSWVLAKEVNLSYQNEINRDLYGFLIMEIYIKSLNKNPVSGCSFHQGIPVQRERPFQRGSSSKDARKASKMLNDGLKSITPALKAIMDFVSAAAMLRLLPGFLLRNFTLSYRDRDL